MKTFVQVFWVMLKIGVLVFVLVLPFNAICNWLKPWPPAMKVLAEYPGEKGICIGGSFETVIELSNETKIEKSYEQKVFILVPSAFSSPKLIIVVKDQDGKISKTESHFGFWFVFLVYSACLWFVWRFGIRPQIKRSK